MKTFVCLLILFTITASAQDLPVSQRGAENSSASCAVVEKFDPARDAAEDIRNAVAEAQQSKRRVLLDVGGEWCIWCHRLDQFFAENKEVSDVLHASFVVVKVNYSKENKNEVVLSQYPKVKGYPHFFVLSETGEMLHSQDTGELEAGKGYDQEKVLAFLRAWKRPEAE